MRKKHRCRDGVEMNISAMDNQHLINMLKWSISSLKTAKVMLTNKQTKFDKLMYGDSGDDFQAEAIVEGFSDLFSPYLLEASIRGLELTEVMEALREVLERDKAKVCTSFPSFPLIV